MIYFHAVIPKIIVLLVTYLLGYAIGRRVGIKEGVREERNAIYLELKENLLKDSRCSICQRPLNEIPIYDNIISEEQINPD